LGKFGSLKKEKKKRRQEKKEPRNIKRKGERGGK